MPKLLALFFYSTFYLMIVEQFISTEYRHKSISLKINGVKGWAKGRNPLHKA